MRATGSFRELFDAGAVIANQALEKDPNHRKPSLSCVMAKEGSPPISKACSNLSLAASDGVYRHQMHAKRNAAQRAGVL